MNVSSDVGVNVADKSCDTNGSVASSEEIGNEKLSTREKLCYGLGDVSTGLAVSSVGIFFLKYLTDVVGLSPKYAGLPLVIGRVWDALADPLIGWITDHTETRWGRRRPYLLFGAIPYALCFFSLWVVPEFNDQVQIFAYVTVTLLLFNTCLAVVFVPYTSMTAAITKDYTERTSLTGYRLTSSQSAMFVGAVFPSVIIPWIASAKGVEFLDILGLDALLGSWTGTPRAGYLLMGVIFGIIAAMSILTTFFGTRERDLKPLSHPPVHPLTYASSIFGELQNNRPFQFSVIILVLSECAVALVAVMIPYYADYVINAHDNLEMILGILFLSAILSIPLVWTPITRKFGKTETYRVAVCLYCIPLVCLTFLTPERANLIYIIAPLAGFFHGAALMIPWAIVPDVVEYDELKRGTRREGLFYGGTTLCYKMATALAVLISSQALWLFGFVPNVEQTPSVIIGIKIVIGVLPPMFLLAGAYLSSKYPLTKEKHMLILKELASQNALLKCPK